jgi:hypothetical protein
MAGRSGGVGLPLDLDRTIFVPVTLGEITIKPQPLQGLLCDLLSIPVLTPIHDHKCTGGRGKSITAAIKQSENQNEERTFFRKVREKT